MGRRAWDQQPTEGSKAYIAFSAYRDMGIPRSIDAAWKQYSQGDKPTPGYFRKWAADYLWVERSRAYDQFIDAQAQKKLERDAITRKAKMLERHASLGRVLQAKAAEYLQKHNIDQTKDALTAARLGIEIERKAESMPDWVFEVVNADETELTRQYNELLAEIGGYRGGNEAQGDYPTGQDADDEADPA